MARDRPSPYDEGAAFFFTAATVKETVFYRSAGACPPRSLHGEGQNLALREGEASCAPQQYASRPEGLSYGDMKNNE